MIKAGARSYAGVHDPCCAVGGHVDISDMCCHQGSGWVSMIWTAIRNHVEVHDPCYCRLLCSRELLLQWYWWLQTHHWEWKTLKSSVTTSTLTPPKKTVHTKQEIVLKMLKLLASGRGLRTDSVFLKGLATGSLTILRWVCGQYKLDLVVWGWEWWGARVERLT